MQSAMSLQALGSTLRHKNLTPKIGPELQGPNANLECATLQK